MARPKKPKEIKKAEGTSRNNRDGNAAPPNNQYTIPQPPSWLTSKAKKAYKELAEDLHNMGVVTKEDRHKLGLVCQEYADYIQLQETIQREGGFYWLETESGSLVQKKRYEVDTANTKVKFVANELSRFGLDPANRNKVSRVDDQVSADPLESHLKKN
jgi:P27 family predicted phage terminase small subunit